MKKLLSLAGAALLLWSCAGEEISAPNVQLPVEGNNVLLLKVDFTTNTFESGKEFTFAQDTDTFTVDVDYTQPADLGGVKMSYAELDEPLFEGQIHWAGEGQLLFPQDWISAALFPSVDTEDFVTPAGGFDSIFDPIDGGWGCADPWSQVQGLVKVRQYLQSNPDADVKVFLYTPGVGVGNPETWKWIFILKN